jgi:hypothetical protein
MRVLIKFLPLNLCLDNGYAAIEAITKCIPVVAKVTKTVLNTYLEKGIQVEDISSNRVVKLSKVGSMGKILGG